MTAKKIEIDVLGTVLILLVLTYCILSIIAAARDQGRPECGSQDAGALEISR